MRVLVLLTVCWLLLVTGAYAPLGSPVTSLPLVTVELPVDPPSPPPAPLKLASRGDIVYTVTAYTAGYESTGKTPADPAYGVTASGSQIKHGDCACSPEFPFGTQFEVEGVGIVTCTDRGGAIQGNRLDIYIANLDNALQFGRKHLKVRRLN